MASPTLPPPDADAAAHSTQLGQLIRQQILAAGGAIPFWQFMQLALYAPGLGYYSAGAAKFGPGGDFVTAPELGPLFARCVADALAPVLRELGPQARFLEIGGGTGAFAEHCLLQLQALDAVPARYAILEPAADLRQRQRERLQAALPPPLFARLAWLDGPPDTDWDGVVFANEVVDALPTPRFALADGAVMEEHVALDGEGRFMAELRPADAMLAAAVRHIERQLEAPFADGYRSELLVQLPYWLQAVTGPLREGALLFADYGYPRHEYYLPQRSDGTVRAFRRHHAVADVFAWPGLQDITASVDFTALAEAGTGAGFDLAGYASQAGFLLGNGLTGHLAQAQAATEDALARHRLAQEAKRLTLPSEMGERFGLMGFQRGRATALALAFATHDQSHRL